MNIESLSSAGMSLPGGLTEIITPGTLAKSEAQQAIAAAGFSTATFTVWIDGQHTVRKAVVTEVGKTVTETTTTASTIPRPSTGLADQGGRRPLAVRR